jgi:peptidyl-prolyl cis-trans isomerase C
MKHTLIRTVPEEPQAQAFSGCSHGPMPAARRSANAPPVFVNGVAIPETAIAREAQNHRAPSGPEARAAAARALVIRELLLQRARELGLEPTPVRDAEGREETPEEALVRQVLELEAPACAPTKAECRRSYEASRDQFVAPEVFEASHILFACEDNSAAAWTAAHQKAVRVIAGLHEGASFADLARRYSACPSAAEDGALGQLQHGDLAEPVEKALLGLHEGAIAPAPVHTRHGWHVVRLDRRTPARVLPFEAVEPVIRTALHERAALAASVRYIARLAAAADIEGLSLTFGASP